MRALFTAAYYCLYEDGIFRDFEQRFLKRDINNALIRECFYRSNWFRLASPNFGRSDLAEEYYDRHIFNGVTFAELAGRGGRPYLVINATDIGTGIRFGFTQEQFDLINSDIGSFPISRAVAASSAVPLLLSPVTLKNYAGMGERIEPAWLPAANANGESGGLPPDLGRLLRSYLDGQNRPCIHLVDGGFSDNLGIRSYFQLGAVTGGLGNLVALFQARHTRRLAFIVVDASADRSVALAAKESTPGAFAVLSALGDGVEKHANAAAIEQIPRG